MEFIFGHIGDLRAAFALRNGEVRKVYEEKSPEPLREPANRSEWPAEIAAEY